MAIDPAQRLAPLAPSRVRVTAPRPAVALIAGGGVLIGVYFLLPLAAQDVLYAVVGLSAVAAAVVGATRYAGPYRVAWWIFAAGLLAEVVGDAIFSWYDVVLERSPPAPSLADVLYLAGYPLLFAGMAVLVARRHAGRSTAAFLDVAIVSTAFALAQWIFLIDPYRGSSLGTGEQLVAIAYPVADILLLAGFAQLVIRPAARTWTYDALFASVLLMLVADEVYGASGSDYATGSWIDALWLASYVLWGAAALDPTAAGVDVRERRSRPRLTRTRLSLLTAAVLTAPTVLVVERGLGHHVHAYELAVGGAVLSVLVLVRLVGLVHELDSARASERLARHDAELAQVELARRNERLEELDRLKDEFVSLVSHDLRTPLTSIKGYVELLAENESLDDESRAFVGVVDRNTDRLLQLVDDLLFVARVQAGALDLAIDEVELGGVAADCVEAVRPRADAAGVTLALERDGAVRARGDGRRIAQLLDNLVSNAVKFTPAGGSVEVVVRAEGAVAALEVADTGIGMSAEDRERLFERFFRATSAVDRQIPGTGLGLHIAKAIVDAHGGRIEVGARPGGGTVFRVELQAP
jgi:signal transduction histidine kinase